MGWEALGQRGDDVARIQPLAGGVANDVWSVHVDGRLAVGPPLQKQYIIVTMVLCRFVTTSFQGGRMRILRMLMASLVLAACASGGQEGASTAPASRPAAGTQKADIVAQVRSLESDPLQAGAAQLRQRLMQYFADAPDITITVCSGVLDPLADSRRNYGTEIFVQQILSSGAFLIENPGRARDQAAVHAAGVAGALQTYESILRANPDARWPLLDQLVQLRERGELVAHVRSRMSC